MRSLWRCAVILAVCSCFGQARAASQEQWKACHDDAPPDDAIIACSYLLGGSDETPRDLATAYTIRGKAHEAKGRLDPALADYSEASRKDKTYARPYQLRGRLYLRLNDYDSAIKDFAQANRLGPHNLEITREFVQALISRAALNPFGAEGQIRDYTEAIRLDPANVRAYLGRASAYSAPLYDRFDRALADYAKVLALDPRNVEAFIGRGEVYRAKQDYDRAFAGFNQALSIEPNSADAHQSRAEIFLSKKDFDRAFADFSKAIQLDPKKFTRHSARAQAYSEKGDLDRAISDYSEAIALNKTERDGMHSEDAIVRALANALFTQHLVNRGELYERKGEIQKAIADYTEALTIHPSPYFDKRADAYFKTEQYDLAIADYTKSIQTNADRLARKFWKRGKAYLAKNDTKRGIEDFSEAIRRDPGFSSAYTERAKALLYLEDYQGAIADFTKLISLKPKNAENYRLRAIAEKRVNSIGKAIADYSIAMRLRPPDSNDTSDLVDRGFLYEQSGDLKRALADYSEAIRLSPNGDLTLGLRGRVYSKKGDLEHAESDFNESLRILLASQAKRGLPKDRRTDWKPKNSLSYELKRAVTSVLSSERINRPSPIEGQIRRACISNADALLRGFRTNIQTYRTALIDVVGAITDARTAIEQFSESTPDKKSLCVADRLVLKKQERDILERLTKLKNDIAAAATKTGTVSRSMREALIDKTEKEYVAKQDGCPSKEKFLFEIESELAPYSAFDGIDEPLKTQAIYGNTLLNERTLIGDARNILALLLSTLDAAMDFQESKISRIETVIQSCRG